jgi:protein-tyrosine phosphatase
MTIRIPDEAELMARIVPIEGVHNFRDVGGYETNDGRVTLERRLYRSDALHNLDDEARARLDELDVRTVVDLRSDDERLMFPDAVGDRLVVAQPIFADVAFDPAPTTLLDVYNLMIDQCGDQLAAAIKAMAAPEALPAIVHCAAGKDRTGVVVALILASIGVPDEVVAADFAATELFMTPAFVEVLAAGSQHTGDHMLLSDVAHMHAILARLDSQYGGAAAYLRAHGVTDVELQRLRDGLTAPLGA